jgi:hypothetical protein
MKLSVLFVSCIVFFTCAHLSDGRYTVTSCWDASRNVPIKNEVCENFLNSLSLLQDTQKNQLNGPKASDKIVVKMESHLDYNKEVDVGGKIISLYLSLIYFL